MSSLGTVSRGRRGIVSDERRASVRRLVLRRSWRVGRSGLVGRVRDGALGHLGGGRRLRPTGLGRPRPVCPVRPFGGPGLGPGGPRAGSAPALVGGAPRGREVRLAGLVPTTGPACAV